MEQKLELAYKEAWEDLKGLDFNFSMLSNEQLKVLFNGSIADGMVHMPTRERAWVFMTELNSRSAARTERMGIILAVVAVFVGIVQVFIQLKC